MADLTVVRAILARLTDAEAIELERVLNNLQAQAWSDGVLAGRSAELRVVRRAFKLGFARPFLRGDKLEAQLARIRAEELPPNPYT